MSRLIAVGVGPGDPELITLKGAKAIREADVVVTPASEPGGDSIAHSIIADLVDASRQVVARRIFPMTRDPQVLDQAWGEVAREIAGWLAQGKTVAFVTLGDPCLYSTFFHLLREMRRAGTEIPLEIVPGVSSLTAAAARAEFPLALGDEKLAILPATADETELRQTLASFETVVLLKVSRAFVRLRRLLDDLGLADRAVYVRRLGLTGEMIVRDLHAVDDADLDYLSLVIVRNPDAGKGARE